SLKNWKLSLPSGETADREPSAFVPSRQTVHNSTMRINPSALLVMLALSPALAIAADWKPADNPLTTPWTAKVTAGHALPEYPRPQMVRPRWTNLNGLWDYAIRPKDEGRPAQFEGSI